MIIYFFISCLIAWFLWYLLRDNRKLFCHISAGQNEIETDIVSQDDGYCIEHFAIQSPRGYTFSGYLKIPMKREGKVPVVLLISGLFTGKDTIELVEERPEVEPLIVATVDYPYEGEKRLKWWQLLGALRKIRQALFNSVFGLLDLIELLSTREEVDADRIYLTGVSFGSFFGMAAATCDSRIKSVASLYGGGKIEKLIATNLPFQIPLINQFIGITAKLIAYPFEPLHYVRHIAPRPLLVLGGLEDERFPKECAQALYDKAQEPKDLVWFKSSHLYPDRKDLINEMTTVVTQWMVEKDLLKKSESP